MKRLPEFEVFVGIDQTGATRPGRPHLPRPLPMAWLDGATLTLQLCDPPLESFDPGIIQGLTAGPRPMAILADCVIGLPAGLGSGAFEHAIQRLAVLEMGNPKAPFGRKAAEDFFSELLADREPEARTCERLAGANSVFRSRPFQKNIQTGTYRLWREISRSRDRIALWPFDRELDRASRSCVVFEGYPSLLWREMLGVAGRKPGALARSLAGLGIRISRRDASRLGNDPDLADAAVLAVGGWWLQSRGVLGDPLLFLLSVQHRHAALLEGWIAGLGPAPTRATSKGAKPPPR